MAKATPLYTLEEQYTLLDSDISAAPYTTLVKYRLLVACACPTASCSLDDAKNRFLYLIQDTELRNAFESLLEVPDVRATEGVNSLQEINESFSANYGLINRCLKELRTLGVPRLTYDLLDNYFNANNDPVYKLSCFASIVMMAYIKEDEINNVKG